MFVCVWASMCYFFKQNIFSCGFVCLCTCVQDRSIIRSFSEARVYRQRGDDRAPSPPLPSRTLTVDESEPAESCTPKRPRPGSTSSSNQEQRTS